MAKDLTVKELILELKKCPQDYKVEIKLGTDHFTIQSAKPDGPHKRCAYWQRRRKVVYLD